MKQIFVLQLANYHNGKKIIMARLTTGERLVIKPADLPLYDTSALRRLDSTFNKGGHFVTYSAADFIGRECRASFNQSVVA